MDRGAGQHGRRIESINYITKGSIKWLLFEVNGSWFLSL